MSCKDTRLLMRLYNEKKLSPALTAEVDRHLRQENGGCAACQALYSRRFPRFALQSFWEEDGSYNWEGLLAAKERGSETAAEQVAALGRAVADFSIALKQRDARRVATRGEVVHMPETKFSSPGLRARNGELRGVIQVLNRTDFPARLMVQIDPEITDRPISWSQVVEEKSNVEVVIPGFPDDIVWIQKDHVTVRLASVD